MGTVKKIDIKNHTLPELEAWIASLGARPYRARQLMRWAYEMRALSFEEMTDLPKSLRARLESVAHISQGVAQKVSPSSDGTRKILFALEDGSAIESVLIPEKRHHTICVSTQVGCAMGCTFCLSGKRGLVRNLSAAEMINQIHTIRSDFLPEDATVNIVFMGMGEPLANYDHLLTTLHILTDPCGLNISHRRITVSTAGLLPQMERLSRDLPVNLAISLNAPSDDLRTRLMPINKTYPLAELIAAASRASLPARKRITFEYILIRGINDALQNARELASLLRTVHCKINLIPFNQHKGSPFKTPGSAAVEAFREFLIAKHFTVMVRQSKGRDVSAACGQLG